MTDETGKNLFNCQLCARVKYLRERRGWSLRYTAKMLGVGEDRYATFEWRTPIPPHLIPKFAALMGVTISYLLIGKDETWAPKKNS